jgi:hypothetical protein
MKKLFSLLILIFLLTNLSLVNAEDCPTSTDAQGCPDQAQKDCYSNMCIQNGGTPISEIMEDGCEYIGCDNTPSSLYCGDGVCDPGEDSTNCQIDCLQTCPTNLPIRCPDGSCANTMIDCESQGTYCGDGNCDFYEGETVENCQIDCLQTCPTNLPIRCPDGSCAITYEACSTSNLDICGNGICESSESTYSCSIDCESQLTCPTQEEREMFWRKCLEEGGNPSTQTDSNRCLYTACDINLNNQDDFCGDGNCDPNEDYNMCPQDCFSSNCPTHIPIMCPDGRCVTNSNECYYDNDNHCPTGEMICPDGSCQRQCGPEHQKVDLPENCFQFVDDRGVLRIECRDEPNNEGYCPPEDELMMMKKKCEMEGGIIDEFKDQRGCVFVHCKFDNYNNSGNFFGGDNMCLPIEEIERTKLKCKDLGLETKIFFEKGCEFATCMGERDMYCPEQRDTSIKREIIEKCEKEGGVVREGFDPQGCKITICEQEGFTGCNKEIPSEAISKCTQYGGEIVSRTDNQGCITFFDCVMRGDKDNGYITPIIEIPSSTKLLQVALSLEALVVKLDQLAVQTESIAAYYDSIGSNDALRFNTVAGMFRGVIEKVNSIKEGIRNNLQDMSINYLEQVKHDIQYIKDVVLMDIVYVMLSSGDDFKLPELNETLTNCLSDETCFDNAFRICKPVLFQPEDNIKVEIKGVINGKCTIQVKMDEANIPTELINELGITAPFTMTCAKTDYAFGFNPDQDINTYCEGNLVSLMKKMDEFKQDAESIIGEQV